MIAGVIICAVTLGQMTHDALTDVAITLLVLVNVLMLALVCHQRGLLFAGLNAAVGVCAGLILVLTM